MDVLHFGHSSNRGAQGEAERRADVCPLCSTECGESFVAQADTLPLGENSILLLARITHIGTYRSHSLTLADGTAVCNKVPFYFTLYLKRAGLWEEGRCCCCCCCWLAVWYLITGFNRTITRSLLCRTGCIWSTMSRFDAEAARWFCVECHSFSFACSSFYTSLISFFSLPCELCHPRVSYFFTNQFLLFKRLGSAATNPSKN